MKCRESLWVYVGFWITILWVSVSYADKRSLLNMMSGAMPISHNIYQLRLVIFFIGVAIGISVFSVLIYTLIRHRQSAGYQPTKFHSSLRIELIWTIIPFIILVTMAVPAAMVLMRMKDSGQSEINIKITGYQRKWQYEYLDYGISFFSHLSTSPEQICDKAKKRQWYRLEVDRPLVVPINKKIHFLVTSNDVMHYWWVPALGIKRDAIPGFIHEAWTRIDKRGIYRGQCVELCGVNQACMPIVVKAVSQHAFDQWVEQQIKAANTGKEKSYHRPRLL